MVRERFSSGRLICLHAEGGGYEGRRQSHIFQKITTCAVGVGKFTKIYGMIKNPIFEAFTLNFI